MPLIEGIGDEVTHFFIGFIVVIIVVLAWATTGTSDHRHIQTVLLLDRRRHRTHRRLTNHTQAVTIIAGASALRSSATSTSASVVTGAGEAVSENDITTVSSSTATAPSSDINSSSVPKPPEGSADTTSTSIDHRNPLSLRRRRITSAAATTTDGNSAITNTDRQREGYRNVNSGSVEEREEQDEEEDDERHRIVHAMDDQDVWVIRERRLAFYDSRSGERTGPTSNTTSDNEDSTSSTGVNNIIGGGGSGGGDPTIMEHNYAETPSTGVESAHDVDSSMENINPTVENSTSQANVQTRENSGARHLSPSAPPAPPPHLPPAGDIKIRLKYLNDDLRVVDGNLHEQLGDFKKRHFQSEMTSNKQVRLIFNGQVLHQDTRTLQSCGLFDNCVVHCLVHPQRNGAPSNGDEENNPALHGGAGGLDNRDGRLPGSAGDFFNGRLGTDNNNGGGGNSGRNNNNNHHQPGRDWDLGNFLFALISFSLASAWYFRYMYAHLYNITATVGLVLLTGVFSIVLFGFYFPDQEPMPQRMDNNFASAGRMRS